MQKQEMIKGYEVEIAYQKQMLDNLGRWFSLLFALATIGLVITYSFAGKNLLAVIAGLVLMILASLGMLLFGYGIYKGRQNVRKLLSDFESKLKQAH